MGNPRSLVAQMTFLISRNKEGSYATHRDRHAILKPIAQELHKIFKLQKLQNLKQKHITSMVSKWKERKMAISTIKNKLSSLRWVAEKLGKVNMIPRSNSELGVDDRVIDYNTDKAWTPSKILMDRVEEKDKKIHLQAMRLFGLRFKEAALFRPNENIGDDKINVIYGTKGGLPRIVPIRSDEQRSFLPEWKKYVDEHRKESLIPREMDYKTWRKNTQNLYASLGITKKGYGTPHGLRHAYAQERYEELSGKKAPASLPDEERTAIAKSMGKTERTEDMEAKLLLSEELGHNRASIVDNYIGKWK